MTYHLIARADIGGLGQQTAELAIHVPPARALIVDLGKRGRGASDPARYAHVPETRTTTGPPTDEDWEWVTDNAPALFAAETAYRERWWEIDAPTVLQANPELYGGDRPTTLTVPTSWEAHRLPPATLLPVPVNRVRLPPRPRPHAPITTWYHPAAPAMLDRNGTRLVLQALRYVRRGVTVIVRSHECRKERRRRVGAATLVELPPTLDYPEAYPQEATALLLPRRYGGLALPMQEAASLGWPIVSLDLEPQRGWLAPEGLVPARRREQRRMVGGDFWVHDCDVRRLAALLDALAVDVDLAAHLSAASLEWAASLAWPRWIPEYRRVLGVAEPAATTP